MVGCGKWYIFNDDVNIFFIGGMWVLNYDGLLMDWMSLLWMYDDSLGIEGWKSLRIWEFVVRGRKIGIKWRGKNEMNCCKNGREI